MMTDERRTVRLPWKALRRDAAHRTSEPTNNAVKAAAWAVTQVRGPGRAPHHDAVILAALRLARPAALLAEIERIEAEEFTETVRPPRVRRPRTPRE